MKTMTASAKRMTPAERFFWTHAGFSYDPKTQSKAQGKRHCAAVLAEAEAWAQSVGMSFAWEWDECPDLSWMSEAEQAEEHEVVVCIARYRDGSVAASLANIVDADRTYRRVVEAELALEAQAEVLASVMEAV